MCRKSPGGADSRVYAHDTRIALLVFKPIGSWTDGDILLEDWNDDEKDDDAAAAAVVQPARESTPGRRIMATVTMDTADRM